MVDERLILAIGRIERALARVEAAAPTAGADPDLRERHEALRGETAAAIARLDRLLADMPLGRSAG